MKIRSLIAIASAGLLAAACSASTLRAEPIDDAPKRTIVLEHGAFADGSSWDDVIQRLTAARYRVIAAANPLRGVAADAAALNSVLATVDGPVVLVGHSYGGSVISTAAAGNPKVEALVYVAAFLPAPGETALDLTGRFPGSTLPDALAQTTAPDGIDLTIRPDRFPDQFAADVDPARAALLAATQRPIAQAALTEPTPAAAWTTIPSWEVITTEDRNIPAEAQRFMARRAGATTVEVAASHSVAISHPDVVADVITRAARAEKG